MNQQRETPTDSNKNIARVVKRPIKSLKSFESVPPLGNENQTGQTNPPSSDHPRLPPILEKVKKKSKTITGKKRQNSSSKLNQMTGSLSLRRKPSKERSSRKNSSQKLHKKPSLKNIAELSGSESEEASDGEQNEVEETQTQEESKTKKLISNILDHTLYQVFITIITIYALFFDDIRIICFGKEADDAFYGITVGAFFFFTVEIVGSSYAKSDYLNSFFFWLDIIATVSLITDIGWIWEDSGMNISAHLTGVAQTTRAGRTTRVIRIIRLVRLIRIVKLYKQARRANQKIQKHNLDKKVSPLENKGLVHQNTVAQKEEEVGTNQPNNGYTGNALIPNEQDPGTGGTGKKEEQEDDYDNDDSSNSENEDLRKMGTLKFQSIMVQSVKSCSQRVPNDGIQRSGSFIDDSDEIKIPDESRVSKKLSEITTQRVIILILAMLFCLPLMCLYTYVSDLTSYEYGLHALADAYDSLSMADYEIMHKEFVDYHKNLEDEPLFYLKVPTLAVIEYEDYNDIRTSEYSEYEYDHNDFTYIVRYKIRHHVVIEAWLSLSKTFFVCIVLGVGSIFFSRDATNLVLNPIERMIEKVKAIAKNPLAVAEEGKLESAGIYHLMEKEKKEEEDQNQKQDQDQDQDLQKKKKEKANFETEVLESTIIKIGALLALGFGEAGSKIIGENMNEQGGGDLNPMMRGSKCIAIFGFCDIRNFTDTTEVLEEEVLLFVNKIADIVHSCVHKYNGMANKNIGDAFLLVWKFNPADIITEGKQLKLNIASPRVQMQADLALLSFIKIIAKLNSHPSILSYKSNTDLNIRIPNYAVKMGFGLHQGWAIEGAIGSFYKIDASYLSPNVNIASRLEAATKQYGVRLLFSGQFASLLSKKVGEMTREIDTVTVKGSKQPLHLFTLDVDEAALKEGKDRFKNMDAKEIKHFRMKVKKKLLEKLKSGKLNTYTLYIRDREFSKMRKKINPRFFQRFNEGYQNYIKGDWRIAKQELVKSLSQKPKDGPATTLLEFIQRNNNETPEGWKGYRELTEK